MSAIRPMSWAQLESFHLKRPPAVVRVVGSIVAALVLATALALGLVPWQQSVSGTGAVVAYSPTEREQHLHAPIPGRITQWHVVEGSRVKKGDPIVEIVDVDAGYVDRLQARRRAHLDRVGAADKRAQAYIEKAEAFEKARQLKVKALHLQVRRAEHALAAARQELTAAEATAETAGLHLDRHHQLVAKGLASRRDFELSQLGVAKAQAEINSRSAKVAGAEANLIALKAEVLRADAEGGAKVASARADAQKATAEAAYAEGDVTLVDVDLARQASSVVRAPVDGIILRIDGNEGGGIIKVAESLAVLVPDTQSRAVELYVDGNDAPLVRKGRRVRLQFEGWPAVQFVGWPSVAVGTFGGRVSFVDPASLDGRGRIRVLVVPDPDDAPWPGAAVLRQKVRAKGWILLDEVRVGWELWRRVNGFPPTVEVGKEAAK